MINIFFTLFVFEIVRYAFSFMELYGKPFCVWRSTTISIHIRTAIFDTLLVFLRISISEKKETLSSIFSETSFGKIAKSRDLWYTAIDFLFSVTNFVSSNKLR